MSIVAHGYRTTGVLLNLVKLWKSIYFQVLTGYPLLPLQLLERLRYR